MGICTTKKAIKRRKKYLTQCNINLLLDDFKKMFEGVYVKKAISSICKINVYKVIPEFKKVLKRLSISYKKQTFEEVLLMADILNGKLTDAFKDYIENYDEYIKVYDKFLLMELLIPVFTLGCNWLIKFLRGLSKEIKKASRYVYVCVLVCVCTFSNFNLY